MHIRSGALELVPDSTELFVALLHVGASIAGDPIDCRKQATTPELTLHVSRKETAMKQYSPFFQTLYDQREPVGVLGRGTHYSVFRVPTWHEPDLRSRSRAAFQDLAVIWDEDHDERIIPVVEAIHRAGLLAPIYFIGERKAGIFVVLNPLSDQALRAQAALDSYRERLGPEITPPDGDNFEILGFGAFGDDDAHIASDDASKVSRYLDSIHILWRLGHKDWPKATWPDEEA